MSTKNNSFCKRKNRLRSKLRKITDRKRLSVFKSRRHVYAQIIDDQKRVTLASASTLDLDINKRGKSNCNIQSAISVGKLIAERASKEKIMSVVFDKGGHKYHGVVKALADEARKILNF